MEEYTHSTLLPSLDLVLDEVGNQANIFTYPRKTLMKLALSCADSSCSWSISAFCEMPLSSDESSSSKRTPIQGEVNIKEDEPPPMQLMVQVYGS